MVADKIQDGLGKTENKVLLIKLYGSDILIFSIMDDGLEDFVGLVDPMIVHADNNDFIVKVVVMDKDINFVIRCYGEVDKIVANGIVVCMDMV